MNILRRTFVQAVCGLPLFGKKPNWVQDKKIETAGGVESVVAPIATELPDQADMLSLITAAPHVQFTGLSGSRSRSQSTNAVGWRLPQCFELAGDKWAVRNFRHCVEVFRQAGAELGVVRWNGAAKPVSDLPLTMGSRSLQIFGYKETYNSVRERLPGDAKYRFGKFVRCDCHSPMTEPSSPDADGSNKLNQGLVIFWPNDAVENEFTQTVACLDGRTLWHDARGVQLQAVGELPATRERGYLYSRQVSPTGGDHRPGYYPLLITGDALVVTKFEEFFDRVFKAGGEIHWLEWVDPENFTLFCLPLDSEERVRPLIDFRRPLWSADSGRLSTHPDFLGPHAGYFIELKKIPMPLDEREPKLFSHHGLAIVYPRRPRGEGGSYQ